MASFIIEKTISDDGLKEDTDIINVKLEDNNILMNSMEQISKIFSISCQKKNFEKCDIRTDIKYFQQKIFMTMIDTPNVRKEKLSEVAFLSSV